MNGRAAARGLLVAASLMLCAAGVGLTAHGTAVPVKAHVAQAALERTFEQRLASTAPPPARRAGEGRAMARASASTALPTTGPVARITVERLGVTQIVLADDGTGETLRRAPTLLRRSEAEHPVTILAAHRDTHFLFIRDLSAGDEITLQLVTGDVERYRVTRFQTVRWDAFAYPRDPARPLLALATCYPFGGTEYGGPWRRIAWAERVA